jgi:hypothetical protein
MKTKFYALVVALPEEVDLGGWVVGGAQAKWGQFETTKLEVMRVTSPSRQERHVLVEGDVRASRVIPGQGLLFAR